MDKVINNLHKQRPKFLNLLQIRLPVTAIASILHRITGVILLLVLPVVIYGLGLSLQDEEGFQEVMMAIKSPAFQFFLVLIATSVFYHLLAGIRFLLLDLDIGHDIVVARWSARIVIIVSTIILFLLVARVVAS